MLTLHRQGILTKIRACEHLQNFCEHEQASKHLIFCEQFEQRPNFASTFKLDGTTRYPSQCSAQVLAYNRSLGSCTLPQPSLYHDRNEYTSSRSTPKHGKPKSRPLEVQTFQRTKLQNRFSPCSRIQEN